MAAHTIAAGAVAKHAFTLAASTEDTVVISGDIRHLEIISDGAAACYYAIGGTATVGGTNTFLLPAGVATVDSIDLTQTQDATFSLSFISAGTPTLSVQVRR